MLRKPIKDSINFFATCEFYLLNFCYDLSTVENRIVVSLIKIFFLDTHLFGIRDYFFVNQNEETFCFIFCYNNNMKGNICKNDIV